MAGRSDRRGGPCFVAPSRARDNFSHRLPRKALLEQGRAEAGVRAGSGIGENPPGPQVVSRTACLLGDSADLPLHRFAEGGRCGKRSGLGGACRERVGTVRMRPTATECCQQLRAEPGLSGRVEGLASASATAVRIDGCCPGGQRQLEVAGECGGEPGNLAGVPKREPVELRGVDLRTWATVVSKRRLTLRSTLVLIARRRHCDGER